MASVALLKSWSVFEFPLCFKRADSFGLGVVEFCFSRTVSANWQNTVVITNLSPLSTVYWSCSYLSYSPFLFLALLFLNTSHSLSPSCPAHLLLCPSVIVCFKFKVFLEGGLSSAVEP